LPNGGLTIIADLLSPSEIRLKDTNTFLHKMNVNKILNFLPSLQEHDVIMYVNNNEMAKIKLLIQNELTKLDNYLKDGDIYNVHQLVIKDDCQSIMQFHELDF